ncbi:methyl-accepting chemotaxis sensory transducer with Cache sensor [Tamilnaduibacter salinus]|uniref:Chemotaxis protein n=1 Tax=Tamilnaduibacter salinus TaxID=1484056 RepID=A0A2A2I528_9GAMM|nr:methyl-accepting chemotaxis protein [Tamilnaduibacter salinus]PAV26406.1 chemotaxis protein [Tamilnaduibacter salinus]PVY78155.1 methyl-accepting chemotaxis sensory transducer with Cache sensor [Tamilnaduibacter salinus]
MGQFSFGQKLLTAFAILLVIVISTYAIMGDRRLVGTTNTYVEALIDDAVAQGTASIAEWLNTRLAMSDAAAAALENVTGDEQARKVLQTATQGGGFKNVYVGRADGFMLMPTQTAQSTLPSGYDPRVRPWYKLGKNGGESTFTAPYLDASSGNIILSSVAPVDRGMYEGVVGGDITLNALQTILSSVDLAGTGYATLISDDGTVLFHPDKERVGNPVSELIGAEPRLNGNAHYYTIDDERWRVSFHEIEDARGVTWYLGALANENDIMAPVIDARTTGIIIAVVALVITLILLHFGIRKLLAPVRGLRDAMRDIASGDADLTHRLEVQSQDELGETAENFNAFVANLQTVIQDVQTGANELSEAVVSLRNTASTSRQSVESQQTEVDMVATAINEMSQAANEIAQNAQQTADASTNADNDARESQDTVKASRDAVERLASEISSASEVIDTLGKDVTQINTILEVIQDVAEQTNLLALNAAIEAARAGDAGRGFAVVADEVRNLARRTHDSTEEINAMIERLQKGANNSVSVMQESQAVSNVSMEKAQDAMDALNRIAEAITSISNMTSQIATASEEQTSVTEELNASITRIAEQGQDAAQAASDNDTYSSRIEEIGQSLTEKVGRFKV